MIYIIRHGQTDWNAEGKNQGHTDIEINETGKKQALEIKEKLSGINFDYVFSSPLKRAYETASIITSHEIIKDNRLIERCNGIFEGKTKSEIDKIIKKEKIDINNPKEDRFGIESIYNIEKRIKSFFDEINDKYKGKNILIVSHKGVIINIRYLLEGNPENNDISKYFLENCDILKYKN